MSFLKIVVCIFPFFCIGQESTLESEGAKGPVKSMTVTYHNAENGEKTGEIAYSAPEQKVIMEFNKWGKMTRLRNYMNPDDTVVPGLDHRTYYDIKGHLTKIASRMDGEKKEEVSYFETDAAGNVLLWKYFTKEGKLYGKHIYKYNKNGKLIERKHCVNTDCDIIETCEYNEKQELIKHRMGTSLSIYKYNDKGEKVDKLIYASVLQPAIIFN